MTTVDGTKHLGAKLTQLHIMASRLFVKLLFEKLSLNCDVRPNFKCHVHHIFFLSLSMHQQLVFEKLLVIKYLSLVNLIWFVWEDGYVFHHIICIFETPKMQSKPVTQQNSMTDSTVLTYLFFVYRKTVDRG